MSTTGERTTVRIPTPLRALTGGDDELAVPGATVGEALRALETEHPGLQGRILDERGVLRRFVNVFVGERNVRSLDGLDTPLEGGAVLTIVPAVAGGAGSRANNTTAGGAGSRENNTEAGGAGSRGDGARSRSGLPR